MRVATTTIIIGSVLVLLAFLPSGSTDRRQEIDEYYVSGLRAIKSEITEFQHFLLADSSVESLRNQFKSARLSYKKIAVISDYFNAYHTKLINGPAISRIEDDAPHRVIEPHGFQKLEEILWAENTDKVQMKQEAEFILNVLNEMENETDRKFKYKDAEVWEAVYQQIIRITALGLSGFDSPVALYSLPETVSALQGIKAVLQIYDATFCCDRAVILRSINTDIDTAISFLQNGQDFNRFNRMVFIRNLLNPLSAKIKNAGRTVGYVLDDGRRPLRPEADNIFDVGVFDVRFYSPNSRYQLTPERIAIGRSLFYDKRLSGTLTRSCATCHNPSRSFTDGLTKAEAIGGNMLLNRNTPTLWNAVYQTKQFYDSRQTMLEFQVSDVVHNISEMKGAMDNSVRILANDSVFMQAYNLAYPGEKGIVSSFTLSNAIASYVRSVTAMNTRFDRYMRNEKVSFSKKEINGFNIFMGKAKCGTCHFVPLFNGLTPPVFNESESEVLGVPRTKTKPFVLDSDSGKYVFTHSPVHLFSFKTPTLRNIQFTAPYMHNGVYDTLEEVVDFYNEGGGAGLGIGPVNQTLPSTKLNLTKREKKDLILFLKTLTDTTSYLAVPGVKSSIHN
jgi:cytochrome c peroxidase